MTASRIAVAGGTGLVGRKTVTALERAGHEVVVLARSRGVDLTTGEGLDAALAGVRVVVDVTNAPDSDATATLAFFETEAQQLRAAEARAGVEHHVLLSILGVDRVEGNAHYAGKRRQEELVEAGDTPSTILRAAQFFEFAEMVVSWTRQGDTARIAPLLLQPVAALDVAETLSEIALAAPQGRAPDLAGPEPQDLVDMTRRVLAARGETLELIPSWQAGPFGVEMAGEVLLPGPGARFGPTTFDAWLTGANR
jgi:uncharacterized protein YbjT (DUF2867 family)